MGAPAHSPLHIPAFLNDKWGLHLRGKEGITHLTFLKKNDNSHQQTAKYLNNPPEPLSVTRLQGNSHTLTISVKISEPPQAFIAMVYVSILLRWPTLSIRGVCVLLGLFYPLTFKHTGSMKELSIPNGMKLRGYPPLPFLSCTQALSFSKSIFLEARERGALGGKYDYYAAVKSIYKIEYRGWNSRTTRRRWWGFNLSNIWDIKLSLGTSPEEWQEWIMA